MRDATKASTTSLLRWSVDWEKAGRCYENAATSYQKAGPKVNTLKRAEPPDLIIHLRT